MSGPYPTRLVTYYLRGLYTRMINIRIFIAGWVIAGHPVGVASILANRIYTTDPDVQGEIGKVGEIRYDI